MPMAWQKQRSAAAESWPARSNSGRPRSQY